MTEEFNKYIGTKEIEARPCTADEADEILGRNVSRDNSDEHGNGYLVRYKDGYISWSPAKAFEEAYNLFGTGASVRERINEISELMSEVSQHPVGTAQNEIELTNKLSILLGLQKQKNKLAMFLERLEFDTSYGEGVSRAISDSFSYSDDLTVPGDDDEAQCINASESWDGPLSESCTITNCTE